ncbi:hypothetical protein EDB92DRAFT_1943465 [Lactarius akahatsu]|uniref:Uncharacterized protein n=1 Tax=Lactarius akahatsu TaxID=416441 RepID=A0AAD4QFI3_9AGAM|nr:hypothetical protein EDB92DRAFT_1943465 [Lactarius akahatsu]
MNQPPQIGSRVQWWDARGQLKHGSVRAINVLSDNSHIIVIKVEDGQPATVTLPNHDDGVLDDAKDLAIDPRPPFSLCGYRIFKQRQRRAEISVNLIELFDLTSDSSGVRFRSDLDDATRRTYFASPELRPIVTAVPNITFF